MYVLLWIDADRLRGARQRAAAPSALPAQGFAPGYPDSMPALAERLAHMPTGRAEQATVDASLGVNEGMHRCIESQTNIICRGLGACYAGYPLGDGEREGRSPLAGISARKPLNGERGGRARSQTARSECERESRRPLALTSFVQILEH
jgi:hypothetical protein